MNDDTIYRQAAIEHLKEIKSCLDDDGQMFVDVLIADFEKMPSAERLGWWKDVEHAPNGLFYATCSVCGKRQTTEATNYCGNCGAKMQEE